MRNYRSLSAHKVCVGMFEAKKWLPHELLSMNDDDDGDEVDGTPGQSHKKNI